MKSHFMKEKEVVLTYRWQFQDERSKGMGTERDKEVLWKAWESLAESRCSIS